MKALTAAVVVIVAYKVSIVGAIVAAAMFNLVATIVVSFFRKSKSGATS